jgi:hypothetical protein
LEIASLNNSQTQNRTARPKCHAENCEIEQTIRANKRKGVTVPVCSVSAPEHADDNLVCHTEQADIAMIRSWLVLRFMVLSCSGSEA